MEGASISNSDASDTPTDSNAAPRTGGSAADSTSQGGIPPLQTVVPSKKKRGRPRKYGPDGSLNLAMSRKPTSSSIGKAAKFELENPGQLLASSVGTTVNLDPHEDTIEDQTQHSQELEHEVSEVTSFTPRIITVNAGEDVTMKVMSFCQQEPEEYMCILSANGVISSATISQAQSSEKLFTYEGKYEIISLSGSFMPNESHGGGMSVSLSGLDGRVVGGRVAGPLVAASPVNVVVGSFLANEQHEPKLKTQKNEVASIVTPMAAAPMSTSGQLLVSSVGATFTPHIIIVNAGEDVTMKVMSFCQQGPEAMFILSANGVTSRATISRSQSSQTLFTYQGRFEIRTLSGSFMPNESHGRRGRYGVMSIYLVGQDGHVVGGRVAGPLVAASPVTVVVGSFVASEQHEKIEVISTVTPTAAAPMSTAGPIPKITSSSCFHEHDWSAIRAVEDTSNNSIDLNVPFP